MPEPLILEGYEPEGPYIKRSQVYMATHDGAGNRLPFMYRSFISFSYGGRWIEDFNLISVTENNSLNRNLSANFEDIVTNPTTSDGQIYWGTHFQSNSLNLTLFTDGITEDMLDDFKQWFQPGVERELILAEHPFRGIMARIGTVSVLDMLPLEEPVTFTINGQEISTSVTNYKGSIHLTFVMDDPFWYSLCNILDYVETKEASGNDNETQIGYAGMFLSANEGITEDIMQSKDALKVIYEDHVPTQAMCIYVDDSGGVGNGQRVASGDELSEKDPDSLVMYNNPEDNVNNDNYNAHISGYYGGQMYRGIVEAYLASMVGRTFNFPSGKANAKGFFYAGTAPSYPIIDFDFAPIISDNKCSFFGNRFVDESQPYSSIFLVGEDETKTNELKITLPSILMACNQALKILNDNPNTQEAELAEKLREGVHHPLVRATVINSSNKAGAIQNDYFTDLTNEDHKKRYHVTINCKTGITTIRYSYNNKTIEENAGDMIVSNYFKITERNCFTSKKYHTTEQWNNLSYPKINDYGAVKEGMIGRRDWCTKYCQAFYHDCGGSLENFRILYKNMYF